MPRVQELRAQRSINTDGNKARVCKFEVSLKFRRNFNCVKVEVPTQTTSFLLNFQFWLFEVSNLKVEVSTVPVLYVLQETVKTHLFFPIISAL